MNACTPLADLQASRAALVEALSTGVRRVLFATSTGRREIEYPSAHEIQSAIDRLDREIAAMQGRRLHTYRPHFSKGV